MELQIFKKSSQNKHSLKQISLQTESNSFEIRHVDLYFRHTENRFEKELTSSFAFFIKYYEGDVFKEDEMGRACSECGEMKNAYKLLVAKNGDNSPLALPNADSQ
jgi:DNA-directed RNA polymerase subunit M/transcription elongation factor TFIIS